MIKPIHNQFNGYSTDQKSNHTSGNINVLLYQLFFLLMCFIV